MATLVTKLAAVGDAVAAELRVLTHARALSQLREFASDAGKGSTIPNTNIKVETPPPPKPSDFAFNDAQPEGADQREQGPRPSLHTGAVGPSPDRHGSATIPNTNVGASAPAADAESAFEEAQGSTTKIINPSGQTASLETQEDDVKHDIGLAGDAELKGKVSDGHVIPPGVHSGP